MRGENNEPIYTSNDEYMRYFIGQPIKGGRCVALNHLYKSVVADEVFDNISEELNVNGNVCEIINKYFEYWSQQRKTKGEKYD